MDEGDKKSEHLHTPRKEKELEMLKEYAEARHEKGDALSDELSAAMEANGGKLPVDMLDAMSMDTVDDLIKSKQSRWTV